MTTTPPRAGNNIFPADEPEPDMAPELHSRIGERRPRVRPGRLQIGGIVCRPVEPVSVRGKKPWHMDVRLDLRIAPFDAVPGRPGAGPIDVVLQGKRILGRVYENDRVEFEARANDPDLRTNRLLNLTTRQAVSVKQRRLQNWLENAGLLLLTWIAIVAFANLFL